jgi:hypothetical protein
MPKYKSFQYLSGKADLPEQMYHVLRCGIVHSFSLVPDQGARDKGGRDRSIVLSHNGRHLSQWSKQKAPDACCLNAEEFIDDIESAMLQLFSTAKGNRQIAQNIEDWTKRHPPIAGNI